MRGRDDGELEDFSPEHKGSTDLALSAWSNFLLGRTPHPGRHQQHLLPLDALDSYSAGKLPANINRYVLRTVEIDIVRNADTVFTFSKIGKLIILGFIDVAFPNQWVGTKVHVREGMIGPGTYSVPRQFRDYLFERTERMAAVHSKISDTQREKISETMMRDLDRLAQSESFKAMQHDVTLSGAEAFKIHQAKPNK
jgi:hypothetical protein